MTDPRDPIFSFLRPHLKDGWNPPGLIEGMHEQLDALGARKIDQVVVVEPAQVAPGDPLTVKVALELMGHEAIVREAYKDSVGVWTWGVGVTDASGHSVMRYRDNPQPIAHCLAVYVWLLRKRYIPDVLAAFADCQLSEAQFAAALSFHYNTGAIGRAGWVRLFRAGERAAAYEAFLEWRKPAAIVERRKKERELFFNGKWSQDGRTNIYPVRKPSYHPDFAKVQRADITADLAKAMAA